MNLHTLKGCKGARHVRKRLGRGMGSGHGKTCGHGHKGQMARKGHKHKAGFEGGQMRLVRRIPKRGFTNFTRITYRPVNVSALSRFDDGTEITYEVLHATGLVNGPGDGVKILGNGDLDKKLTVKVQSFSGSARSKIEAAGGTCDIVRMG